MGHLRKWDYLLGGATVLVFGIWIVAALSHATVSSSGAPNLAVAALLALTAGGVGTCLGSSEGFRLHTISGFIVAALLALGAFASPSKLLFAGGSAFALGGSIYALGRGKQIGRRAALAESSGEVQIPSTTSQAEVTPVSPTGTDREVAPTTDRSQSKSAKLDSSLAPSVEQAIIRHPAKSRVPRGGASNPSLRPQHAQGDGAAHALGASIDQLERLTALHISGAISDAEFEELKRRALST